MRTSVTNHFLITALSFILSACAFPTIFSDIYTPPGPDSSMKSLNWQGVYTGNLSCDDNNYMQTVIMLRSNFTFFIKTKCRKESSQIKRNSGVFSWDRDGNIIELHSFPNEYGSPFFEVGKDYIAQLNINSDGNENAEIPDYIVLKREVNPILERTWLLADLLGSWLQHNDRITMVFKIIDQRVVGSAGCNGYGGKYIYDNNVYQFKDLRLQLFGRGRYCTRANLEREFMRALQFIDDIHFGENYLILSSNKQIIAKFELVDL